jgi:DNA-binding transcriptional regulator YbjK
MNDDPAINDRQRPLMEATLRIIGRLGVDGVTHRAVAAEADMSLGAITHHFSSRDHLVEAALRHALARETGRLRALSLSLQNQVMDIDAWIDALAAWYARELRTDAEVHIACYEAFLAAARSPRYRDIIQKWFATWQCSAELALKAAGSSTSQLHAEVFVSALIGVVLQQLAAPRRSFRRDAVTLLTSLVDGLLGRR